MRGLKSLSGRKPRLVLAATLACLAWPSVWVQGAEVAQSSGAQAMPETQSDSGPPIQRGTIGPEAERVQSRLKELGHYDGPVDGRFGRGTEKAVKSFQREEGLMVDGVVGPGVWKRLFVQKVITEPVVPKAVSYKDFKRQVEDLRQRVELLKPGSPPQKPPASPKLHELERRATVLESLVIGSQHTRGLLERGPGWKPGSGFFLQSADGNHFFRLSMYAQADYRAFPGGQTANSHNPGTSPDTFSLRRMRTIIDGRLFREFHYQGGLEWSGRQRSELLTSFIEWERFNWFRPRVGQFKPNVNIEMTQSGIDLVFIERSLVQNLNPYRDFGVQITGRVLREQVRYDLGVLNGSPVGPSTNPDLAMSNGKMLMARLMVSPFSKTEMKALRQMDFGLGFFNGSLRNQTGQQAMITMAQDRTIFQYGSNVTGAGDITGFTPFLRWYWGRLGLMSIYSYVTEREKNLSTNRVALLHYQAWAVEGTFLLTDDVASFTTVKPKKPFDLSKGHWGAWEVAARVAELDVDPDAFALGFASPTSNVQTTKGLSVGLNWYLYQNAKVQVHWEHSDFKGYNSSFGGSGTSNALITRVSLMF